MKLRGILVLFAMIVMVKGTWWTAAVQPVILSLGAVLSAIDLDALDVHSIEFKKWLPFINKQKEMKPVSETTNTAAEEKPVDAEAKKAEEENDKYRVTEEDKRCLKKI